MKIDETKIAYCKKLYLEQQGRDHKLIEKSMREAGYSFCVRCLYRNCGRLGWIEKYEWKSEINEQRTVDNGQSNSCRSPHVSKGETTNASLVPDNTSPIRDPSTLSFEHWLKTVSPGFTWDWEYQKLLYKKLRDVTSGKTKRLMIFMPPRHGKSELVTVRYAAWRLQRDPRLNIIISSYNQKLANRFSRKIKNTLQDAVTITACTRRGEPVDEAVALVSEPGAVATGLKRARSQHRRRQPAAIAGGSEFETSQLRSFATRPANSVEE